MVGDANTKVLTIEHTVRVQNEMDSKNSFGVIILRTMIVIGNTPSFFVM